VNQLGSKPVAWATKWWPNRQFTFILSVAEANAVQAWARGTSETAMPTLEFQKKLAMQMMQNKRGDYGVAAPSPHVCISSNTHSFFIGIFAL
jgi:hypothetical protein